MKQKTLLKNKHLKLDQSKINAAKKYFRVDSEQEAIDRAVARFGRTERRGRTCDRKGHY